MFMREGRRLSATAPCEVGRSPSRSEGMEMYHGRLARASELVAKAPEGRMLDIGSKSGWLLSTVGERPAVGVDVEWPEGRPCHTKPCATADGRWLPFRDESFDIVTIFDVIEHVPKRTEPQVLGEAYRVLKGGGMLVLSTPQRHLVPTVLDPAWWLIGHRHYTSATIGDLLRHAGFEIVDHRSWGRYGEATFVPFMYLFDRLPVRMPFEQRWLKRMDHEYLEPGWCTMFVTALRPVAREGDIRAVLPSGMEAR